MALGRLKRNSLKSQQLINVYIYHQTNTQIGNWLINIVYPLNFGDLQM